METSEGTAVRTSADVVKTLVHDFLEMLGDGEADRLILHDVDWLLSILPSGIVLAICRFK